METCKKLTCAALLLAVIVGSGVFMDSVDAATYVNWFVGTNIVWAQENSTYTLDGPIALNNGVILTVEPGVTVNLNNYYIRVNGTLIARGTDTDKITFTGGSVEVTSINQQLRSFTF